MGVLTESEVRKKIGHTDVKEFYIEKGQIITPSAKSYLTDKNIVLKYVNSLDEIEKNKSNEEKADVKQEKKYKYVTVFGANLDEKPEHMTSLNGNLLVFKDHKRIILRGKVDSLESRILQAQILCQKHEMKKLLKDLQEVLEEKLEEFKLLGLTPEELREQSHYPKKYFGIGHEFPNYEMGEMVVEINSIRTLTREVELAAYEAFKGEYGQVEREDLIKALNRLSSVFWIMIYKIRTNKYK